MNIKTFKNNNIHFIYKTFPYYYLNIQPHIEIFRISCVKKLIKIIQNYKITDSKIYPIEYIIKERDSQTNIKDCFISYYKNPTNQFQISSNKYFKQISKLQKLTHTFNLTKNYNNNIITIKINNKHPIQIHSKTYTFLKNTYNSNNNFDLIIWTLIYRYSRIDMYSNIHLSIPKHIKLFQQSTFNESFELFASAFNHYYQHYCSLFPDIERHFGSICSFHHIIPIYGTYGINPPFSDYYVKLSIHKIIQWLSSKHNLTFLYSIPVWLKKDRILLNKKCKTKLDIHKFWNIHDIQILLDSKFNKHTYTICKENMKYYDYITHKYIKAAASYIMILSNFNIQFNKQKYYNIITK